ncbi:MAG: nucleoside deaminase [Clostridia bacterium]|nr:nucleoside deaminase [Clostridia bacterium]
MREDEIFMAEALAEARAALDAGEVPVGAVVVKNGEIIGRGRNTREGANSPLGHAELSAIEAAAKNIGDWRLSDCTLYVSLEPCPMCSGAIVSSRVGRVVYAAADKDAGCLGSVLNMAHLPCSSGPKITAGCCEGASRALMQEFFEKLRKK